MSGLIKKDMYCLKKNLRMFLLVTVGVIVLSVMFIISAQSGNVAQGISQMKAENDGMSEADFYGMFQMAVWAVLFIPIAFVGMIVECFKEDRKAGFYRYMMTLPLSEAKLVGSRYISLLMFMVTGVAGSCIAAVFVSLVSDYFELGKLLSIILTFAAVLLVYMSIVMLLLYIFGTERADFIQCAPFVAAFIAVVVVMAGKISSIPENQLDGYFGRFIEELSDIIARNGILFMGIAIVCAAVSYLISCKMLKQRRGNI